MTADDDVPGRRDLDQSTTPALDRSEPDWAEMLATEPQARRPGCGARVVLGVAVTLAVLVPLLGSTPLAASFTGGGDGSGDGPADSSGHGAHGVPRQPTPPLAPPAAPPTGDPVSSAAVPSIAAPVPTPGTPGHGEITPDGRQARIAHRDTTNERGEPRPELRLVDRPAPLHGGRLGPRDRHHRRRRPGPSPAAPAARRAVDALHRQHRDRLPPSPASSGGGR